MVGEETAANGGLAMNGDTIFLINENDELERIPCRPYDSEDLLQRLVESHPEILVGDQIDPDNPPRWLLIDREVGIPDGEGSADRWAVDHLLLDQDGRPTFVEVKRSTDTRIRREVVGQMLDYAANANVYWPKDKIRALAAEVVGGIEQLDVRVRQFLTQKSAAGDDIDTEGYWEEVDRNLRNGAVRLLFVADVIPTELRRVIEFLNGHMPLIDVLGVEIRQYEGQSVRALVPRVIGQTESARQQKATHPKQVRRTTQDEFLGGCPGRTRQFFFHLINTAKAEGYEILWGTKGFSVRLSGQSGASKSLFYAYPVGIGWPANPLFQAYLGYVDDETVAAALRKDLLKIAAFAEKGKHTLEIALADSTADELLPHLPAILRVPKQLLRIVGN